MSTCCPNPRVRNITRLGMDPIKRCISCWNVVGSDVEVVVDPEPIKVIVEKPMGPDTALK